MDVIYDFVLEPIRKLSFKLQSGKNERWYSHTEEYVTRGIDANQFLFDKLHQNEPFMLSRLGTSELHTILNYLLRDQTFYKNIYQYLKGTQPEFWWGKYALNDLSVNSGFFPSTPNSLSDFSQLYLEDLKNIDVLLTWLKGEKFLDEYDYLNSKRTNLYIFNCEPYFFENPWTKALKQKTVLVIHPFEASIQYQYNKRHLLFSNGTLPDFELKTLKAIQSIPGNNTGFESWFNALDYMKSEVDNIDFDIALIGAGAYGLPLAAHIKRKGKIGLHLGGFLQLIFGIRGKRWDLNEDHRKLMNEYWKHPYPEEYPVNYKKLDHGSYW